jgi:hypothetical protein
MITFSNQTVLTRKTSYAFSVSKAALLSIKILLISTPETLSNHLSIGREKTT